MNYSSKYFILKANEKICFKDFKSKINLDKVSLVQMPLKNKNIFFILS